MDPHEAMPQGGGDGTKLRTHEATHNGTQRSFASLHMALICAIQANKGKRDTL